MVEPNGIREAPSSFYKYVYVVSSLSAKMNTLENEKNNSMGAWATLFCLSSRHRVTHIFQKQEKLKHRPYSTFTGDPWSLFLLANAFLHWTVFLSNQKRKDSGHTCSWHLSCSYSSRLELICICVDLIIISNVIGVYCHLRSGGFCVIFTCSGMLCKWVLSSGVSQTSFSYLKV